MGLPGSKLALGDQYLADYVCYDSVNNKSMDINGEPYLTNPKYSNTLGYVDPQQTIYKKFETECLTKKGSIRRCCNKNTKSATLSTIPYPLYAKINPTTGLITTCPDDIPKTCLTTTSVPGSCIETKCKEAGYNTLLTNMYDACRSLQTNLITKNDLANAYTDCDNTVTSTTTSSSSSSRTGLYIMLIAFGLFVAIWSGIYFYYKRNKTPSKILRYI
jgi:hypothetical protein